MKSWSERINPQPMFDVLSMARRREEKGNYVARMEIGDTPGFRNDYLHSLISKYATSPFRYSPSQGEKLLLNKVIETQWPNYSENQIVIGPANFLITAALASKTTQGDYVLLPDPGFATYKLAADFLGLNIVYYPVYSQGKAEFPDLSSLVKGMDVRPKAVIVNNPSNPLGIAFNSSVVSNSLRNFPDLGINIVFDETYVNLVYDNTEVLEETLPATRIRSFSKEHCAPGVRIGYAASDTKSATVMSNLMSLSISCVPQFLQFAVADYLGTTESEKFTFKLRNEMQRRLNLLHKEVPRKSIDTIPNSAFYALLGTGNKSGDLAFEFLLDRNVSTCPGSKFGSNSLNTVRVSLAGHLETFESDVSMLSSGLNEWFEQMPVI
jgi:aspartate/methionine/tyrosine aminotransferase